MGRSLDLQDDQRAALGDRVADGDLQLLDGSGLGAGISIEDLSDSRDDQRVLGGDRVANRDEDLGDGDVGEVADVGDKDIDVAHRRTLRRSSHSTPDQVGDEARRGGAVDDPVVVGQ